VTSTFVAGGTLKPDAVSYIERAADHLLLHLTLAGEYCTVLTTRQMGKSSLMARTCALLRERSVACAAVDLQGRSGDQGQWYFGITKQIAADLNLSIETAKWWSEQEFSTPAQRMLDFLVNVVLQEIRSNVVIFIDEVDWMIRLDFSDEFFATIRSCYNRRATDFSLDRLTFVLLGSASPSQLIKDVTRTPFNIARGIDLTDFTQDEAKPLARYLGANGSAILERIFYWTDGHPYLTQMLCAATLEQRPTQLAAPFEIVDSIVNEKLLPLRARSEENNLKFVSDRLAREGRDTRKMLGVYRRILRGERIKNVPTSWIHMSLRLTGIVKVDAERMLRVRNRAYRRVFNEAWVRETRRYTLRTQLLSLGAALFVAIAVYGSSFLYSLTPDARYQNGRLLLEGGKLTEAMREAEAGFRTEHSWRFRILEADILLARFDIGAARALLAFPQLPSDGDSLARLALTKASLEYYESDYSGAETLLDQAIQAAKPLGRPLLEAMIENRRGMVLTTVGRLDEAELAFRHVIEVSAAGHDLVLEARATYNLGVLFLDTFQLENAIYWFEKARVQSNQLGLTGTYFAVLGNLGTSYQRLGDSDKALEYFQQAENHAAQIGDLYQQQLLVGNIAEVLSDRGDLERASEKFQQALTIARKFDRNEPDSTGLWYFHLASLSIERGDFEKAEFYNDAALRHWRSITDTSHYDLRVNVARIAAGLKDPRAEELYRGLIAEYRKGINPVQMLEVEAGMAELLSEKGQFDQADAQFRAALRYLDSERATLTSVENRMTYLAKLTRFYERYVNFLVDRGQAAKALEVAESSRARVLKEASESKAPVNVLHENKIREMARSSRTIFLSYWLGKKRSFLWTITPDEIVLHELPAEGKIAPLVAAYRSLIENLRDPLQSEFPVGRELSEELLGPVRPLLASKYRVVVVPDRSLYLLNFQTLPDPEDPSKYLLERLTLKLAPSLGLLADALPQASATDSLLLIGDPKQAVEEFPRLPFAASELEQISKMFAPEKLTLLSGAQANPAAYRSARPARFSRIHFAAHIEANLASPLDSALILSRADTAYKLSAREVMNVPLNANVVSLSACRSAAGKIYPGEGLVGLPWAFLRAGAGSVVAGLWDVTDRSTTVLMADFYDQLSRKIPPEDALRHAKLSLLHGVRPYQRPFYWGAFQIYAGTI
jgi:CHAT domain-containing protein/Tfp pilus assembly protein PilF